MATTISPREIERTNRWLTRSRRFGYVPPEPFALLSLRLAARRRAVLRSSPLIALSFAVLVCGAYATSGDLGRASWSKAATPWFLAADAIAAPCLLLIAELGRRADSRIARLLPHRVSRGIAIPVWRMLGSARLTYLVTAIVSEVAFVVVLLVESPGWLSWTALGSVVGASVFVAFGLKRATTRPTIATDPISLEIDEMLRSEEAFGAVGPLLMLAAVLLIASEASGSVALAWGLVNLPVQLFWLLALNTRPWPTVPRPLPRPDAGPHANLPPLGAIR
jgi:hypothetical protein